MKKRKPYHKHPHPWRRMGGEARVLAAERRKQPKGEQPPARSIPHDVLELMQELPEDHRG